MPKTILADVDGFTPIIDDLARQHGLMRAAVFGRIWRYCQMKDGICRASLETLSDGLGVDRATVMRHAKALAEDGYLEDTTPNLRNQPHIYRDTGKASIRIAIGAVAQSKATVAECNVTVAQSNVTVAESKLKILSKKDSKKEEKIQELTAPKPRGNPAMYEIACALAEVTYSNLEANKPMLMREAKLLLKATNPAPTPELIKQHYNGDPNAFWKARDWRGKKGQPPTPYAIRTTWGQWEQPDEANEPAGFAAIRRVLARDGRTIEDLKSGGGLFGDEPNGE